MTIHVRPGSRLDRAGGDHDGALVVRVRARAVDQAATAAALEVVAQAFGVRPSAVRLERGATSRVKVVSIEGDAEQLARRRDALARDEG